MIEIDDEWCMTKVINVIVHDELERDVASLSIKEKKEFVILTLAKVVDFVPFEAPSTPKIMIETGDTWAVTRSWRHYTLEEFDFGGQKKYEGKNSISEGE